MEDTASVKGGFKVFMKERLHSRLYKKSLEDWILVLYGLRNIANARERIDHKVTYMWNL